GLRLLLVPDSTATAVEVASWFEADARPGVTRLLERLVSRARAGQARRVAAEGGTSGSFSTYDLPCFFETLPAGSLELGFELEAERMSALSVSAADLDAERARARAERQARESAGPASRGLQRLYAAHFPALPYRLPPSGTDEDIARLTVKDCQDA